MASIASVYPPEMWAQEALMVLERSHVMANLVHRNFEPVVAERGDVIHTRRPTKMTVNSLTHGAAMTLNTPDATDVTITLDQHDHVAFRLTDRDMATSVTNLIENFVFPSVSPMAKSIDDKLMSGVSGNDGLADAATITTSVTGTSGGLALPDFAKVRGQLRTQEVPMGPGQPVYIVLGTTHEQEALSITDFVNANTSGLNPPAHRTGFIRELYGMQVFADQGVPTTADTAADAQSLAFHRNAMALVTRPLSAPQSGVARSSVVQKDGIGIRAILSYDHLYLGWLVSYDILYGFKILDANLATRLVSA